MRLLELIRCPACEADAPLTAEASAGPGAEDELVDGWLRCPSCDAGHPVLGGIAVLAPDVSLYLAEHAEAIERSLRATGSWSDHAHQVLLPHRREREPASAGTAPEKEGELWSQDAAAVRDIYLADHYDPGATTHEVAGWWRQVIDDRPRNPAQVLVDGLPDDLTGTIAIDVGTSTGSVARTLADRGATALGLDYSFSVVAVARQIHRHRPQPLQLDQVETVGRRVLPSIPEPTAAPLDFVVGSGEHLPVATASCGVVTAMNVLCVLERPERLIAEAARALEHGGRLLLATPYVGWSSEDSGLALAPEGSWLLRALAGGFSVDGPGPDGGPLDQVPWVLPRAGNGRVWDTYLCQCVVARRADATVVTNGPEAPPTGR